MSRSLPERLATRDGGDGREVTLRVPENHACFEGHFPGQPIVPGIVLLHWVVTELARWQERELEVAALDALKFRRPVTPGEAFALRLARTSAANAFSFEMEGASGPISSGRVRVRA